jgi:hypothetical protein
MTTTGVLNPENNAPHMPTPNPLTSEPTITDLVKTGKEFHIRDRKFEWVAFSITTF